MRTERVLVKVVCQLGVFQFRKNLVDRVDRYADAIKAAQNEKQLTVTIKTTATSEFIWNDGSNEKTLQLEELRDAVEEASNDYDVIRFILDNRVGIPIDTIYKVLTELEDAKLANYLY